MTNSILPIKHMTTVIKVSKGANLNQDSPEMIPFIQKTQEGNLKAIQLSTQPSFIKI